jgi:hypothetical protein
VVKATRNSSCFKRLAARHGALMETVWFSASRAWASDGLGAVERSFAMKKILATLLVFALAIVVGAVLDLVAARD